MMNSQLHKALIFTDLHITAVGETIIGLDPALRFSDGLDHALSRHPDAQHLIILGDLTNTGRPAEYARLMPILADCPIPVTVTMGNHDLSEHLLTNFPDAADDNGFVQSALDLGPARLLVLDTFDYDTRAPLEQSGWICDTRLAWLDRELARARRDAKDVVVLGHHPPCAVGFSALDRIGLANADALFDRLRAYPDVKQMICGHIHRTIHVSAGGLPVSILKSPCHQVPMNLGQDTFAESVDEPGAYGILLAMKDTIVVHTEDFALPATAINSA